ncbi:uncharacterized protein FFB20_14748 [Fusarium fujikuroi]|uniref:Uncharacterized protein n=1 Tax=Gibberella fujikuroi (strain CBS 195.34 / IMI 58289 / NRRL A-6831) TaxID=1279085 RepID=S0DPU7_GIBF5|nr:uncharacterized protein FFUJ_04306 [Fusarium fujikuroi IMI 58289]SCN73684.1 uncharacterized protein FFE2_02912 [Fusarium fujikuroi]CCT64470.1 uncharacterized protein FFUJ_04306 [Fusarium fujikuroi IMI 58289]SCN88324.1 uncharacterized protein FFM5_04356 [Fusarium fujikuroi]SCO04867.1 uncharacterized protein FFC1_09791 [Fusarium fujikuroi]SCO15437.1 uncharacterized protein FFB20_14748 [Fusarium fujikuroi]
MDKDFRTAVTMRQSKMYMVKENMYNANTPQNEQVVKCAAFNIQLPQAVKNLHRRHRGREERINLSNKTYSLVNLSATRVKNPYEDMETIIGPEVVEYAAFNVQMLRATKNLHR